MAIERFTKRSGERKRYTLDYTDWLDTGETLSSMNFSVSPTTPSPLVVDGVTILPGGQTVDFYVNAGTSGTTYTVTAEAVTSAAQTKQDLVLFSIRDQ